MKTKEEKQKEALARQEKYDSLSIEERINLVTKRPGNSSKELNKLLALKRKQEDNENNERQKKRAKKSKNNKVSSRS